jgi:hypothetical protein
MSYEDSRRAHPSSGFPIPPSDSATTRPLSWLNHRVIDMPGLSTGIIADLVIAPARGAWFDGSAATVAHDYDQ